MQSKFGKKVHIVSLSGGKDSVALLYLMLQKGLPVDIVLNFDLGKSFSVARKVVDIIEQDMKSKDIIFVTLKPVETFEQFFKKYGWMTINFRWCRNEFKVKYANLFYRYLRSLNLEPIYYLGYSSDENRAPSGNGRALLQDWGITGKDALNYCKSIGIDFEGHYDIFSRLSCYLCPLQGRNSLFNIYNLYPKYWKDIKYLDSLSTKSIYKNLTVEDLEKRFKHRKWRQGLTDLLWS